MSAVTSFAMAAVVAVSLQAQAPWTQTLADADALVQAGLHNEAIAGYERLIQQYPDAAPVHLSLAKALVRRASETRAKPGASDFRRSQTHFRRAIDLGDAAVRRDALFELALSFSFLQPDRLKEGVALFDQIVAARPTDVVAHLARARVWFTDKTMAAYVTALKTTRDRFPDDSEVRLSLGTALRDSATLSPMSGADRRRALLAEARIELDHAVRLDPKSTPMMTALALMTKGLILRDLVEFETDPKKAAALEAEAKRLFAEAEKIGR